MFIVYAAESNEAGSMNVVCPETRIFIQQGKSFLQIKITQLKNSKFLIKRFNFFHRILFFGGRGNTWEQTTNCQSCICKIPDILQSLDLHTFVSDVSPHTHTVKDTAQITSDVK